MNNKNSVKTVVAVAIGAALFFVLGRFVAIPSGIPNTNISLQCGARSAGGDVRPGGGRPDRLYRPHAD